MTLIGAGVTLHEALKAADELSAQGIAARVIDLYSVKPVDEETIRQAAADTGAIVTVEDHWPEGGLGDAVLGRAGRGRGRPRPQARGHRHARLRHAGGAACTSSASTPTRSSPPPRTWCGRPPARSPAHRGRRAARAYQRRREVAIQRRRGLGAPTDRREAAYFLARRPRPPSLSATTGCSPGDGRERVDDLVGQPRAVVRAVRRGLDPHDDVVPVELLEQDRRRSARRRLDLVVEDRLDLGHADARAKPDLDVDRFGLPDRDHHGRKHDVVRHHDPVLALGERRVEQAERADDPLDLSSDGAGLEADALADAERSRAQQHHAGEQVAERLLRGKTEDHGGECARRDQRAALTPAISSATRSVMPTVTRRTRKPTVPAVPGSIRRKNVGPATRPMSRAIAQPSASSASTVTTLIGVIQRCLWVLRVDRTSSGSCCRGR